MRKWFSVFLSLQLLLASSAPFVFSKVCVNVREGAKTGAKGGKIGGQGGKMLGAKGIQTESSTVWRKKGCSTTRIEVENPAPGKRPGQVHYHDKNNTRYMYDPNSKKFYNKDGKTSDYTIEAPRKVNDLLKDRNFKKAIDKAMRYLGE